MNSSKEIQRGIQNVKLVLIWFALEKVEGKGGGGNSKRNGEKVLYGTLYLPSKMEWATM